MKQKTYKINAHIEKKIKALMQLQKKYFLNYFPIFMSFQFSIVVIIQSTGIWIDACQETRTSKPGTQVEKKKVNL